MVGLATEVIDLSIDRLEKPRYYSIQDVMACLIFRSTTNNSRSYRIVLLTDSCVYFYIFSMFNLPILIVPVMMRFGDIINFCFCSYGIITSRDSLFCIRYRTSSSFLSLANSKFSHYISLFQRILTKPGSTMKKRNEIRINYCIIESQYRYIHITRFRNT